jgi:hypothetical protein
MFGNASLAHEVQLELGVYLGPSQRRSPTYFGDEFDIRERKVRVTMVM